MPYEELGLEADRMLVRVLTGEKKIEGKTLPAYPVIRESCGCNTMDELVSDDNQAPIETQEQLLAELKEVYKKSGVSEKRLEKMLNALFDDSKPNLFYNLVLETLTRYLERGGEISRIFHTFKLLRHTTCLSSARIENILRIAAILLPKLQAQIYSLSKYEEGHETSAVNSLKSELLSVYDREKLISILEKYLPIIGIQSAAIVLYENSEYSQYIGGFDATGELINETSLFPANLLFPAKFNRNFENGVSENNGGAINNYGELTLNDVKFENNITRRLGGAIYTYKNSKTTISNAKFNNNVSEDSQGGAIYNRNELHITSAGFIGNVSEGDGGAIFNCRGKLDLIDTRFTDNISSTSGGAFKSHQESRITVINNIFENNNAMYGGAINLYYCDSMTIRNSKFNKNQSTHRGGVIYNNSCKNIEIYESSFTDNNCPKEGGVIHCSSGTIKIFDCVFDGNEAGEGGAIYEIIGSIDITNSTIKNSTASKGGAIYNGNYLRLFNTSFENNKADDGAGIYNLRLRIGNNPFAPPKTESKITINNVTFRNNVSNNRGGALYNEDTGIIQGDGVTFDGNKANEGDNIWAENDDDINISSVNNVGGGLGGIFKR